jgi:ribose transport system permease protein
MSDVPATAAARPRRFDVRQLVAVGGPLLGLLFVLALFALDADVRPYFFTWRNVVLIGSQTAVVAVGALGMTMIIVSGGIDLSVGSAVALTSVVCAVLLSHGAPAFAAILTAILAGGALGVVNGAAIGALRLVPFVVTLGTMGIARGLAKWLAGNQTVNPSPNEVVGLMSTLGGGNDLAVPVGVWVVLLLAAAVGLVMTRSVFGRHVYAIGSNEDAARLCGIRVPLVKLSIYALAGALFGFAGVLQFARLTQGDPTVAIGLELDVIAAVVLGGASLSGGTGSVLGAMIGALIMAVLRNGSNQMGWPNYAQEIIIGLVIILAVGLDRLRRSNV